MRNRIRLRRLRRKRGLSGYHNSAIAALDLPPSQPKRGTRYHPAKHAGLERSARKALEELFLRAQGKEWRDRYTAALSEEKPIKGGDSAAVNEYVQLVCEHVELLNRLVTKHREHVLPVSRARVNWPVLKSKHPHLSEDERAILTLLEVGKESGFYLDEHSKWKPSGRIAWLVDELVQYVISCKNCHRRRKERRPAWVPLPRPHLPFETEIFARPLWNATFERRAAVLKHFDHASEPEWEALIVDMLESCFRDASCAGFLSRKFVTAPTKRKSLGRAKQHLLRRVRARLKSLAGRK